jgi:hypothetical protein
MTCGTSRTDRGETEHMRTLYRCHHEQMSPKVPRASGFLVAPVLCEGVDPMGRGRAKAKQTKVARRLKYQSLDTDFDALQRELGTSENDVADEADDDEYDDDPDNKRSARWS